MNLTILDISIVVLYLATMVAIGWVLRKRARKNKESYLLGGKALPWYMLGLSDASDMFDIERYYVDGGVVFCIWHEIDLDTLVMACV